MARASWLGACRSTPAEDVIHVPARRPAGRCRAAVETTRSSERGMDTRVVRLTRMPRRARSVGGKATTLHTLSERELRRGQPYSYRNAHREYLQRKINVSMQSARQIS